MDDRQEISDKLEFITSLALNAIPNLIPYVTNISKCKYETKIEYVAENEFNIIVTANGKNKDLEKNFTRRLYKPFIKVLEGKFDDVIITDYSRTYNPRENNTHVAHVVVPYKYLK